MPHAKIRAGNASNSTEAAAERLSDSATIETLIALCETGQTRIANGMKNAGITTVGELRHLLTHQGDKALLSMPGFGKKSFDELKQALTKTSAIKKRRDD